MTIAFAAWLFAVSLGASALGGMLGMAGGIFVVPILTIFGRLDIRTAIGASIVSVIACSCGSAAAFLNGRLTNIRLAIVLETATTLGALSGVVLAGVVPASYLFAAFAAILLLSAQQMLSRRDVPVPDTSARPDGSAEIATATATARDTGGAGVGRTPWTTRRLDGTYPDRATGRDVGYTVERVPLGMALMYGAGLISALLGIGSGVLKIPAMDTALRLPIKVSSATSNFMIGVTAAASAGVYFVRGDIVPAVAGPVALGAVVGSVIGARILMAVSGERIRLLFVVVLGVLAVQMLLAAFGIDVMGGGGA